MISDYLEAPWRLARMRDTCVGPYIDGFSTALTEAGYSPFTIRGYLRAADHVARWADRSGIDIKSWDADISSNTLWEQTERLARVLMPPGISCCASTWCRAALYTRTRRPGTCSTRAARSGGSGLISRHDAVFYRVDPSRAHSVIVEMLEGFDGALVSDGYSAYGGAALKALAARSITITLSDCWSHARRGFVEAEASYPECAEAIRLIGEPFLIERELPDWEIIEDPVLRAAQLDHIRDVRATRSACILEELRTWANTQQALPQSKLGEALTYLKNQWDGLKIFLSDPRVPLSNNHAERSLRGVVTWVSLCIPFSSAWNSECSLISMSLPRATC
jgi:transposase